MTNISEIFKNYYLICSFAAFMTAQIIKFLLTLFLSKTIDFKKFISNGGMPSSHSATVCALTASVGICEGVSSSVFAVSFILATIVMIDAMGVRRATGENAKVINKITRDIFVDNTSEYLSKDLKELVGHKPIEVVCGAVIGIVIPFILKPF